MKRSMRRFTYTTMVIFGAVLFCMTVMFGNPPAARAETPGAEAKAPRDVEARISDFHSKLKITQAQEEQWGKVAQAMRENAAAMEPLIKERKSQINKLNAVDDLKSYSKLSEVHNAGLNKFIAAFEPLYASMSDEQKKIADKLFTRHERRKASKKK